jgi:hypothetical protein
MMSLSLFFNSLLRGVNRFSHRSFEPRPLNTFLSFSGVFFFLLASGGCNGSDPTTVSHGGAVRDHVSLVDSLRRQGLTVEPTGSVTQPFFSSPGQILRVNGQDVQVFEFEDPASAHSMAKEISTDGMSIGHTVINWVKPPHFFSTGKIIVLYVGSDPALLRQLEIAMGKQITGSTSE